MDTMTIVSLVGLGFVGLMGLILLLGSVFTIEQQTVGVIQRFGKFNRLALPGLGFKIPLFEQVVHRVSLRQQQLPVPVETKTLDNVFVNMPVTVQYEVITDKVKEAYYKLSDPKAQMATYVQDVVRAKVPTMKLDEVFERKNEVAIDVKTTLAETMDDFGFRIVSVQIPDVEPAAAVKEAMNKINAAQRHQVAAIAEAEAAKIRLVKNAEAESESKRLQGEGIANQRKAIIHGLRESVQDLAQATGVSATEVMKLVMTTQFMDTIKDIGHGDKTKVIFLPYTPGALTSFEDQIRTAMMGANEATVEIPAAPAK